ncbi:unnamed protein product [Darwinula stevensoni]|uniref:Uncharacterized protein n=1 Tax=Darwinula stevensoni TaxID=69355 RepID=A0A7R9AB43_9CRUS|nr:unnamed protein product [Darwinula stevensoni]CAG0898807.1 unnamed protein product [Darwinula stevensoni]
MGNAETSISFPHCCSGRWMRVGALHSPSTEQARCDDTVRGRFKTSQTTSYAWGRGEKGDSDGGFRCCFECDDNRQSRPLVAKKVLCPDQLHLNPPASTCLSCRMPERAGDFIPIRYEAGIPPPTTVTDFRQKKSPIMRMNVNHRFTESSGISPPPRFTPKSKNVRVNMEPRRTSVSRHIRPSPSPFKSGLRPRPVTNPAMKSQLGAALLLGLVLVGVHADGDGDELLDEARCLGGRITSLGRNSLRSARTTCLLATTTTTTTANPNGDSVLSAHLQREILELYHELSESNNTAAGEKEILPRFANGAESAQNVASCIATNFASLLQQEAALKLCIITGAGWVQSGQLSQTNILSSFAVTSATVESYRAKNENAISFLQFTTAVTDCVTTANAVTGDAATKDQN